MNIGCEKRSNVFIVDRCLKKGSKNMKLFLHNQSIWEVPASGDIRPWSKLRSFYCLSRSFQLFWMSFPLSWFLIKSKVHFASYLQFFFMNIWLLKPDWWFRFSCGRNMLEVIATSPPQKPWLAVAPGQVLDEAKGGQQWGSNFKLVRHRCTHIFNLLFCLQILLMLESNYIYVLFCANSKHRCIS